MIMKQIQKLRVCVLAWERWMGLVISLLALTGCATIEVSKSPYEKAVDEVGEQCYRGRADLFGGDYTKGTTLTPLVQREKTISQQEVLPSPPKRGQHDSGDRAVIYRLGKSQGEALFGLLEDIHGARFKPESGELLLIGPPAKGQGLRADDWATLLQAVVRYGAPGVSIDPGPDPDHMVVRYFGGIEETKPGEVFFEADRSLKLLSTGFDNSDCSRTKVLPPAWRTELELMEEEALRGGINTKLQSMGY